MRCSKTHSETAHNISKIPMNIVTKLCSVALYLKKYSHIDVANFDTLPQGLGVREKLHFQG